MANLAQRVIISKNDEIWMFISLYYQKHFMYQLKALDRLFSSSLNKNWTLD